MKRILSVVAIFLMATTAMAQHTLDYLMMNIVLDTNGDAYVQELRQMNIGEYGTENYITFNNLPDGMNIEGLKVREDSIKYTFDEWWNLDRTREEKTFHCGYNHTDSGIEVCWGLGQPGKHTYIVSYVITNLVRSYEESDGFNHSFYEAAHPAAKDAFVVIHALQRNDSIQHTPEDIWNLPYFQITSLDDWADLNILSSIGEQTNEADDQNDPTRQEGMTPWGNPVENGNRSQLYSVLQLRLMADSLQITVDSLLKVLGNTPAAIAPLADVQKPIELKLDTLKHPSTKAWAFGYHGFLDFYANGSLRALNDTLPMNEGQSIIIMAEFEKGMFTPAMEGDVSKFETVKERAFYDSDYTLDDVEDGTNKRASLLGGDDTPIWVNNLVLGIAVLVVAILILLPIYLVVAFIIHLIWGDKIKQKKWDKKMSKLLGEPVKDLPYYRDPPAGGKLTLSQRILSTMRPTDKLDIGELIEAFMMRLLYKGVIQLTTETTNKGKVREVFMITKPEKLANDREHEDHKQILALYSDHLGNAIRSKEIKLGIKLDDENFENLLHRLLYYAAGDDHLLQPNELKDYIEKYPLQLRPYVSAVNYLLYASVRLETMPKEESKQVYGFYKFLKDFTLVNERGMTEVGLWQEYLVFASLYGIADQVRKDMKKVAPDISKLDSITSMLLSSGTSTVLVGSLIDTMQKSYQYAQNYRTAEEIRAAKAAAAREASVRRYSGGGGRSSFGGGGGHSGGGGSGVR